MNFVLLFQFVIIINNICIIHDVFKHDIAQIQSYKYIKQMILLDYLSDTK